MRRAAVDYVLKWVPEERDRLAARQELESIIDGELRAALFTLAAIALRDEAPMDAPVRLAALIRRIDEMISEPAKEPME